MRAAGLEKDLEAQAGPRAGDKARDQDGHNEPALDGGRPVPFDARMLLGLQAAAGNAAVSGLIAESRASPPAPASAVEVEAPSVAVEPEPPVEAAQGGGPPNGGPGDDDLASLDAHADAAHADGRDGASMPAGPSGSDVYEGGGGGGGSAIEDPAPVPTPVLDGLEPSQALASAAALPAGQFLGVMGGVAQSVDHTAAGEQQRLLRQPPSRVRHPGAPGTVDAPASQRVPISPDRAPIVVPQVSQQADVAIRGPAPLPTAPALPTAVAPDPIIAGSGNGELSPADTQQIATSIARLPTTDGGMNLAPGPLPHLPLAGSTDPGQVRSQQAELDQSLAAEHARGRQQAAQDYGERAIFPTAPTETLVARVDAAFAPADGSPLGGARPDEAVSLIAQQEKGDSVQAAARAGVGEMAQQRQVYAEKTSEARAGSELEISAHERANIAEQAGMRNAAQQEVLGHRSRWTQEQHELVDRARDESTTTTGSAIETVSAARTKADDEAAAHYREGQAQAATAQREAEANAAAERQRAQQQGSGGFFGMLASAARSVFDAAKHAVQSVFDRARQLVRGAIERAHQLALAAMERAKQTIVAAIQFAGSALRAIGDRVPVALSAVRDRFRHAIQECIARAEAAVNRLSNTLKLAVQSGLDLLGRALSAAVAGLRRGMHAIVDRVRQAAQSAVDFARNAIAELGTFAVLVRDVAANPGRWLGNLAAAAQDGIRNHLWPDLKLAVQSWFTDKVDAVLGLGAAAWSLLKKGGITVMQVAGVAWDGLKAMIPQTIIWVLIEKLVALIVPAAAAVMLIIQALQAAWGSIGRIIQAFDAFMAFLKGVRWGSAGPLFGKAVAAGAVAVIEFISQFLLQRLMGAAGKVAGKIRSLAQRIGARLAGVGRGVGKLAQRGRQEAGSGRPSYSWLFGKGTRNLIRKGSERLIRRSSTAPSALAQATSSPELAGSPLSNQMAPSAIDMDRLIQVHFESSRLVLHSVRHRTRRESSAHQSTYIASYSDPARRFGRLLDDDPSRPGRCKSKIDCGIASVVQQRGHAKWPTSVCLPGKRFSKAQLPRQLSEHGICLGGGSQVFVLRIDPSWEVE